MPRMLFDDSQALFDYVSNNSDPALRKWWAQYQEFCGEFEQAEKYYQQCQDYLSLIRVFCCLERFDEADKLAKAAAQGSRVPNGIRGKVQGLHARARQLFIWVGRATAIAGQFARAPHAHPR